jgi:hypothetical protein
LSNNSREFLGIVHNDCHFQGKVHGDPVIQGDSYAFLWLKTTITEAGANGQWTDTIVEVPVITTNQKLVAVIEKYVKDGRELSIKTNYKPWVGQDNQAQHVFVIETGGLKLGRRKYVPDENKTPPLPVK